MILEASCGNDRFAIALDDKDSIEAEWGQDASIDDTGQGLFVAIFKALDQLLVWGILDEEVEASHGYDDDSVGESYEPLIVLGHRHIVEQAAQ